MSYLDMTDLGLDYCIAGTINYTCNVAPGKYQRGHSHSDRQEGKKGPSFVPGEISPTQFKYISQHFNSPFLATKTLRPQEF
jgi:hypothetical protein